MKPFLSLFCGMSVLLLGSAAAQADARLLASNCFQCHGTDGRDNRFEDLAGKSARDIYDEMKEMQREPSRSNIMYPHANGYTDGELRAIADYFASLRKP
jgi:sulfide dehydrogenase cytochrome subunit